MVENSYDGLVEGKDYVVCSLCGFKGKKISAHIKNKHNINVEDYKKTNSVMCSESQGNYKKHASENGSWIVRAKEQGKDLSEYLDKMGKAVRESILSNPEERKRRAEVMAEVNRSDIMRKKASDTAKITSARKDIQHNRSILLKRWRTNYPNDLYNKCIKKMSGAFRSRPEMLLLSIMCKRQDFNFKSNQTVKSELFTSPSKRKQVDIGDKKRRLYIEYDGPLHFKQTKLNQLEKVKEKDTLLDAHIIKHGWTLIRVGYDQFSYRKSDYGFKPECLAKIDEILKDPKPGVYLIGEVYDNNS